MNDPATFMHTSIIQAGRSIIGRRTGKRVRQISKSGKWQMYACRPRSHFKRRLGPWADTGKPWALHSTILGLGFLD